MIHALLHFSLLFYRAILLRWQYVLKLISVWHSRNLKYLLLFYKPETPSILLIHMLSIIYMLQSGICSCASSTPLYIEKNSFVTSYWKIAPDFIGTFIRVLIYMKIVLFLLCANVYRHWYICFYIQLTLISHDAVFCNGSWSSELVNNGS